MIHNVVLRTHGPYVPTCAQSCEEYLNPSPLRGPPLYAAHTGEEKECVDVKGYRGKNAGKASSLRLCVFNPSVLTDTSPICYAHRGGEKMYGMMRRGLLYVDA